METRYSHDKTLSAQPSLKGNFVPDAKMTESFTYPLGERNLTHFGSIFLIHQFCKRRRLKSYLQKKISFSQRFSDCQTWVPQ